MIVSLLLLLYIQLNSNSNRLLLKQYSVYAIEHSILQNRVANLGRWLILCNRSMLLYNRVPMNINTSLSVLENKTYNNILNSDMYALCAKYMQTRGTNIIDHLLYHRPSFS